MESNIQHHEGSHPTPATYVRIALVLAVITAVEVWAIYIDGLRHALIPILLVLSVLKFVLVALFFMHLKFDSRIFTIMFAGGLTLAVSIVFALMALFKIFA